MKEQLELQLEKKIPRGQIDQQEYARVLNISGEFHEYVHGTYEEVENYCKEMKYWVDKYLNHVDPMTVQRHFKYVGSGHNPCSVATPFWSEKIDPIKGVRVPREFKEKF
jgi:hypothetical protein